MPNVLEINKQRERDLWAALHSAVGTGMGAQPAGQTWLSAAGCAPEPSPPPVRKGIQTWVNNGRLYGNTHSWYRYHSVEILTIKLVKKLIKL